MGRERGPGPGGVGYDAAGAAGGTRGGADGVTAMRASSSADGNGEPVSWGTTARARRHWDRVRDAQLAPATELMLDLAGVVAGSRVLVVAAGAGAEALAAARRVGPSGGGGCGWEAVGGAWRVGPGWLGLGAGCGPGDGAGVAGAGTRGSLYRPGAAGNGRRVISPGGGPRVRSQTGTRLAW